VTVDAQLMLTRRMLWDLLPHNEESIREDFGRMGIPFGSDDVAEMEHAESHLRTLPCIVLSPYINQLAAISAKIVNSMMKANGDMPEDTIQMQEDTIQMQEDTCEAIIRSSASVIIAHLISAGLLKLDETSLGDLP
jgi:hypothetical protein